MDHDIDDCIHAQLQALVEDIVDQRTHSDKYACMMSVVVDIMVSE
jgi:hypothetical protein